MTTTVSRPRAAYVPGGGEAWRSPWAGLAALRDHDPVHHVVPDHRPDADFYVLTRHADVLAAAVDTATYSSAQGLTVEYGELEKIGLADNPPLVMLDPPDHTAFRRLVSRGFTPRQVVDIEPAVREYVVERVDRIADARPRRHRGRALQAAAEHGRGALPRRPSRGPRPVRRLDRRDRRGQLRPATRRRPRTRPRRCSATSARWSSGGVRRRATTPSRTSSPPESATTRTGSCRSSATCSRWSPAATTPRPGRSAAPSSCSPSGRSSARRWPPTRR